jgi:predicted RNase H-like HicB family nuclease
MTANKTYTACIYKVEDGYIALSPEIEGANGQGDTIEEARENLSEAIKLIFDYREEEYLK